MKVTTICVSARSGANNRPVGGEVSFEDGRSYGWGKYGEETRFYGSRRMPHGGTERFSFLSAARASALERALDGKEPDAVVEDYGDRYRRQYPRPDRPEADSDDGPGF